MQRLPSKSGFICICPLCPFSTRDDSDFASHIVNGHKVSFQELKRKFGNCQFAIGKPSTKYFSFAQWTNWPDMILGNKNYVLLSVFKLTKYIT